MILGDYVCAGILFCLGLHTLLTRRNLIKMVMGLSLMEASTYVLLLSLAHRPGATAPVLLAPPRTQSSTGLVNGNVADPVLQNFCLTAIVIGVAVTALSLAVVVRVAQHHGTLDSDEIRAMRG